MNWANSLLHEWQRIVRVTQSLPPLHRQHRGTTELPADILARCLALACEQSVPMIGLVRAIADVAERASNQEFRAGLVGSRRRPIPFHHGHPFVVSGEDQEFRWFGHLRQWLLRLELRHVRRHPPGHVLHAAHQRLHAENVGQAPDGLRVVGVKAAFLQPPLEQVGESAFRQSQLGVERHGLDLLLGARAVQGAVDG
jgi:hypothetical protein